MKAKTEKTPSPTSQTVTFYNYRGASFWSHSAVEAGPKYLSVHPITHFIPPVENKFRDPDDGATKILEIIDALSPMFFEKAAFGVKNDELSQYEYEKIDIPVTNEQFEQAQKAIEQHIHEGENGITKYSVLKILGKSCAEGSQTILEVITQNTTEAPLAQRNWFEHIAAWPQSHFKRVEKISQSRQQTTPATVKVSVAEGGLFAPSNNSNKSNSEYDAMDVERLTLF